MADREVTTGRMEGKTHGSIGLIKAELVKCADAFEEALHRLHCVKRAIIVLDSASGRGDPSALAALPAARQILDEASHGFSIAGAQNFAYWTRQMAGELPIQEDSYHG